MSSTLGIFDAIHARTPGWHWWRSCRRCCARVAAAPICQEPKRSKAARAWSSKPAFLLCSLLESVHPHSPNNWGMGEGHEAPLLQCLPYEVAYFSSASTKATSTADAGAGSPTHKSPALGERTKRTAPGCRCPLSPIIQLQHWAGKAG